jgi:GR25 family glycosyltransferase involved in LPS biosynthesis
MKLDKVYFINLDRREDRLNTLTHELKRVGLYDITERFSAIDGNLLSDDVLKKWTTDMCNIFCQRNLIGCAMSHMSIWKRFYESSDNTVLILEDDASFTVDNIPDFLREHNQYIPDDFDILYLGCFGGCFETPTLSSLSVPFLNNRGIRLDHPVTQINDFLLKPFYPLGLHGYILSRKGCEKLLRLFPKITNHIDIVIANKVYDTILKNDESSADSKLKVYTFKKQLVVQAGSITNTDNVPHAFPSFITRFFDNIKLADGQSLGYVLNVSSYQIPFINIPLNLYTVITFILGIILAKTGIIKNKRVWQIYMIYAIIDIFLGGVKNKSKSIITAVFLLGVLYTPYTMSRLLNKK